MFFFRKMASMSGISKAAKERKEKKEGKELNKLKICQYYKDNYDELKGPLNFTDKKATKAVAWDKFVKYCNEIGFPCKSRRNLTENIGNWNKTMNKKVVAAQRTGHGKREPLTDYQQILRDIYYNQSDVINVSTIAYYQHYYLIYSDFNVQMIISFSKMNLVLNF